LHFFGDHTPLADRRAFAAYLTPPRKIEWVVYAKRPFAGPEAVLAYLSRYTHRVAIANSRLIAFDDNGVTFRWKDYRATGRDRQKVMTLASDEFIRRFLIHVLPSGLHRIRHHGIFANGGGHPAHTPPRPLRQGGAPRDPRPPPPPPRRLPDTEPGQRPRRAAAARAPMPVLRWPHDHHRDLRARLDASHASVEPDQNRHIMIPLTKARRPIAARPRRRSSTADGDARLKAPSAHAPACHVDGSGASRSSALAPHPPPRPRHAAQPRPTEPSEPQLPTLLSP